jgi:hypothetical protein
LSWTNCLAQTALQKPFPTNNDPIGIRTELVGIRVRLGRIEYDVQRIQYIESLGYRVFRVTNDEVLQDVESQKRNFRKTKTRKKTKSEEEGKKLRELLKQKKQKKRSRNRPPDGSRHLIETGPFFRLFARIGGLKRVIRETEDDPQSCRATQFIRLPGSTLGRSENQARDRDSDHRTSQQARPLFWMPAARSRLRSAARAAI